MYSRYQNTRKIINSANEYKQILDTKKVNLINQYFLFDFTKIENNKDLSRTVTHIIKPNEKLFMISNFYYRSPEYGWFILYTNNISNELVLREGDSLTIYLDIFKVIGGI